MKNTIESGKIKPKGSMSRYEIEKYTQHITVQEIHEVIDQLPREDLVVLGEIFEYAVESGDSLPAEVLNRYIIEKPPQNVVDLIFDEVIDQLPEEELAVLGEIFNIIQDSDGDALANQRRLEEIAETVIFKNVPAVGMLIPLVRKMRDMSALKNITYKDHLEYMNEILNPRGIMNPKIGKPLSVQRFASAIGKLRGKMRDRR